MKSARTVLVVAAVITFVAAGVGVILSDSVEAAIWPALVLLCSCALIYSAARRLPPPKPWDRKRALLAVAATVPTSAFLFGIVLIPMIRQTEDSTVRLGAVVIGALFLASLALLVIIARREHRIAQGSRGVSAPD
jgi:hypothetical protein